MARVVEVAVSEHEVPRLAVRGEEADRLGVGEVAVLCGVPPRPGHPRLGLLDNQPLRGLEPAVGAADEPLDDRPLGRPVGAVAEPLEEGGLDLVVVARHDRGKVHVVEAPPGRAGGLLNLGANKLLHRSSAHAKADS